MLHGRLPARQGNYEVRGLIVHPENADRILAATGGMYGKPEGVYLSADGGESWNHVLKAWYCGNGPHRADGFVLYRNPVDARIVVTAAVKDGAWLSPDDGQTWQSMGLKGLYPTDVRFDYDNPARLWLCAVSQEMAGHALAGGFFRSEDGGKSWKQLLDVSPSEILQDPNDPNRLYGIFEHATIRISKDNGETWTDLSDGLLVDRDRAGDPISEYRYSALADGPGFILTASGNGTIYRLDKGAGHWRKVERKSVISHDWWGAWGQGEWRYFGKALADITVDPLNQEHWFLTDWTAIYQTFDSGATWDLTIDGIETTVVHNLAQDPSDPGVVHMGMADIGSFLSDDGGVSFRHNMLKGGGNNIRDIALSPALTNRVYAVGSKGHDWFANQLFVSMDRGESWIRSPMTGLPDMSKRISNTVVVDPLDCSVVYLTVSGKIEQDGGGPYISRDGGKSWKWMGDGLPKGSRFYSDFIFEGSRELAVGARGRQLLTISRFSEKVYFLDTDADSWAEARVNSRGLPHSVAADIHQPGVFYLGALKDGIYRTSDGGRSWKRVYSGDTVHLVTDKSTPDRVAAGTVHGVVFSRDGGETWEDISAELPYRVNNMLAFAGDRIVVGSTGSGAFWIPLNENGELEVHVKPSRDSEALLSRNDLPVVLDFVSGGEGLKAPPPGGWAACEALRVSEDATEFMTGKTSLRFEHTDTPETASTCRFSVPGGPFTVEGRIRAESEELLSCSLVLNSLNEEPSPAESFPLIRIEPSEDWKAFDGAFLLPESVKQCEFALTIKGVGRVWLDELRIRDSSAYFGKHCKLPSCFPRATGECSG